MKISTNPDEYLINSPIYFTDIQGNRNPKSKSNFYLRGLRIQNNSEDQIQIEKIEFILKCGNKELIRKNFKHESLNQHFQDFKEIGDESYQNPHVNLIHLGQEEFWDFEKVRADNCLSSHEEVGFLSEMFEEYSQSIVDELEIQIHYSCDLKPMIQSKSIPIKNIKSKNEYILPLKGAWLAYGTYDNRFGHRSAYSQEYAIDFVQLDPQLKLDYLKPKINREFSFYKSEIYAAADGIVVDCVGNMPENTHSNQIMILNPEKQKELIKKFGFFHAISGNFVIIEHVNHEYSFYAHMVPGSLRVQIGDKISQGNVIGLLGNSGNSEMPHLHFHIMDQAHIFKGRGIPCRFSNILDETLSPIELIQRDFRTVHSIKDELYKSVE
jgi:hypothetical protein